MFERHLQSWGLTADGEPIATRNSRLLPVRRDKAPAMIKIAIDAEEKRGDALMSWWDGKGAARVLEFDGDALLLERAIGSSSLKEMVRQGQDDDASRIICGVAAELHAPRQRPRPKLFPLEIWFGDLEGAGGFGFDGE